MVMGYLKSTGIYYYWHQKLTELLTRLQPTTWRCWKKNDCNLRSSTKLPARSCRSPAKVINLTAEKPHTGQWIGIWGRRSPDRGALCRGQLTEEFCYEYKLFAVYISKWWLFWCLAEVKTVQNIWIIGVPECQGFNLVAFHMFSLAIGFTSERLRCRRNPTICK